MLYQGKGKCVFAGLLTIPIRGGVRIRDGSRISGKKLKLSQTKIYISVKAIRYLIIQAVSRCRNLLDEDILLSTYHQEKYWMETAVLDLRKPQIINPQIRTAGWGVFLLGREQSQNLLRNSGRI